MDGFADYDGMKRVLMDTQLLGVSLPLEIAVLIVDFSRGTITSGVKARFHSFWLDSDTDPIDEQLRLSFLRLSITNAFLNANAS